MRQAKRERRPRLTQHDLVALLEAYGVRIQQAAISEIEAGDRPVLDYELRAIGQALAVRVSWLIHEEESP